MEQTDANRLPTVAIFGRTNVGKSTLFNRLIESKQALVSAIPGTTRDSNENVASWQGRDFRLVDTAGLMDALFISNDKKAENDIDQKAQKQVAKYLKEADVLIFLVDNKDGLMPEDREIAKLIRRRPHYVAKSILTANKVDNFKQAGESSQFNRLGLGEPMLISAATGSGTGDLLDRIMALLPENPSTNIEKNEEGKKPPIRVCLVGKPNVGKSSFFNRIIGYEKAIVSEIPHTTREPKDTEISYQGRQFVFIDTAGLSKHGHKQETLEKYSMSKSLRALDESDVALLMIDVSDEITHQDLKISEEVVKRRKSAIIIANKWDAVPDRDMKKATLLIQDRFPFIAWVPIHFVSAKNGFSVNQMLDMIISAYDARAISLSNSQLSHFLNKIVKIHPPAKGKGIKAPRIYELTQPENNPPFFEVRVGTNDNLHFSYVRFMENQLRKTFGFFATPITLAVTRGRRKQKGA